MNYKKYLSLLLIPLGLVAQSPRDSGVITYTPRKADSKKTISQADQPIIQTSVDQSNDERIGISVFGDYLYWKPYLSNAIYALVANQTQSGVIPADGKTKQTITNQNLTFTGDSGFRVGLSYENSWHNIGIESSYTRFFTSTTRSYSNNVLANGLTDHDLPNSIYPVWNTGGTTGDGSIFYAQGTGLIHFQEIDFVFTTKYKPISWFTIMPTAGARGLITKTELNVLYEKNRWGGPSNIVYGPPFNTDSANITQKFDAIGALVTLKTNFDIGWGISSFCNGSASYVVGNRKVHNKIDLIDYSGSAQLDLYDNNTTGAAIFDLDLGLQYEWLNAPKNFGVLLQVAYEVHFLPNFFSIIYLTETFGRVLSYKSDLTFQGLRVRGGISF